MEGVLPCPMCDDTVVVKETFRHTVGKRRNIDLSGKCPACGAELSAKVVAK